MTITSQVRRFLDSNPGYGNMIDLINHSALARVIQKELGLPKTSFDAVLAACRRYDPPESSDDSFAAIKRSRISARSGLAAIRLSPDVPLENTSFPVGARFAKGPRGAIIIIDEVGLDDLAEFIEMQADSVEKDLAEISIETRDDLQAIPGVHAFLHSLLARKGVGICCLMSLGSDITVVVKKKFMAKAMSALDI